MTPEQIDEFIKDNFLEMTTKEIANKTNRTTRTINYRSRELGLKKQREYAVYHGDELQVIGSASECVKYLGIKENSFYRRLNRQTENSHQQIIDIGFWRVY